ncbi:hypothetical protein [Thalassospira marina]|uniref:Uncharacterized protein n=1 Tax=Thalassospira marina TaxID=2048283 RepID=A0A2N3KMS6_9PROT|nr:hypothetical protein [Thalassospira marina]PKR51859.1 hypothetical protein COO20_18650 [Thalassospira marina]
MLLNSQELQSLKNSAETSRKLRLKAIFLGEIATASFEDFPPAQFFERNFEAALMLPSIRDDELLDLCQIAYLQQCDLFDLAAFQRCQSEQKWPARALYLSAVLEKVKESGNF